MGKVEKWVVLGVLALIVGILVVSLTVDDPLKRDKVVIEGSGVPGALRTIEPLAQGGVPAAEPAQDAAGAKPSLLMNSSVSTAAPETESSVVIAPAIPAGSILKTMEGLEDSYMTDTKFYTWKAGDTFPALAQRFYGDLARLATLRRVNEGRNDVQPGDRVLVPVFDPDAPPTVASNAGTVAPVASGASKSTELAAKPAVLVADAGPRVHVVQEGESLWIISKKELGSGARWKEIYGANRDQLSSPEALRTGIKLRVP